MPEKADRAPIGDTIKMSLLCEVKGACPLCRRSLIKKRKGKTVRVFDVAHIYPFNATEREKELLKGEELLSQDIDCEENFIALCKECHKIYDTQKTVEEYRQLVAIKKAINKAKELSMIWDNQTLHRDIVKVATSLEKLNQKDIEGTTLSFSAIKLSEKKDETLSFINELKIQNFIILFFTPIKEAFKSLELEDSARSLFIYSQVKSYYLALLIQKPNQDEIFEKMCDWFTINTGIHDRGKAEVLASYFIQNCEIFSKC